MLLQVFIAIFDTNSWTPVVRVTTPARRLSQLSFEADTRALLAMSADGRLLRYPDVILTAASSRLPQCWHLDSCSGVFCADTENDFVAVGGNTGQLALYPLHWTVRHEAPEMICSLEAAGCSLFDAWCV
jgi:hypothetical protein